MPDAALYHHSNSTIARAFSCTSLPENDYCPAAKVITIHIQKCRKNQLKITERNFLIRNLEEVWWCLPAYTLRF